MPPKIQTITDPKKAKALANETRIKILQEIASQPQTISQLAKKIGITPVAILYHTKKLQNAGFIRISKTNVVNNNLTEKYYEITTDAYLVALGVGDEPVKGPVPPKSRNPQLVLGVTVADIEKMLGLLGLTYLPENKMHVEGGMIKLLEKAVLDAGEVQREILSQSHLKLSAEQLQKLEYAAMAVFPIVIDRMLSRQEDVEGLRSIIGLLQKTAP